MGAEANAAVIPDLVSRAREIREEVRVIVAQTLLGLREASDFSQADIAWVMSEVGFPWTQSTVSMVERGKRRLAAEEAAVLAYVFNVRVSDILPEITPQECLTHTYVITS